MHQLSKFLILKCLTRVFQMQGLKTSGSGSRSAEGKTGESEGGAGCSKPMDRQRLRYQGLLYWWLLLIYTVTNSQK